MRTKTILLSAVVGVLSSASLMAQVYSLNAVGYINVTVPPGFSLIANQLNTTNNNISPLLDSQFSTGTFDGCALFKYSSTSGQFTEIDIASVYTVINGFPEAQLLATNTTLNPGEGAFFQNSTGSPQTLTFVGTVLTGALSNNVPKAFSIISSQVPQAGAVDTALGLTPQGGDAVFLYSSTTGKYQEYDYTGIPGLLWGSSPSPVVNVGQSFFYQNASGAAEAWQVSFSVN